MNIVKMWCTRNLKIRSELDGRSHWRTKSNNKSEENRINAEFTDFVPLPLYLLCVFRMNNFRIYRLAKWVLRWLCLAYIVFNFHALKADLADPARGSKNKWMPSSLFCGRREPNVECNFPPLNISWDKVNFLLDTHTFATHIRSHRNVCSSIFRWSRIFNEIFHWVTNIKRWSRIMALPAFTIIIIIICAHARQRFITHVCNFFFVRFGFGVMQILPSNQSFVCCEGKANRIY